MERPDFEMAQNRATEFLLKQTITGLTFDPRSLDLREEGIIIDTIENYALLTNQSVNCFIGRNIDDCYTVRYSGYNIILYSDYRISNINRKIFGIAHELGHIYCGHIIDGPKQEIEANYFAAQVLMPEIVVYYILKKYKMRIDSLDLIRLFDVSFDAAERRINTFNKKGFWNVGHKDMELLDKFKPYVDDFFRARSYVNTTSA